MIFSEENEKYCNQLNDIVEKNLESLINKMQNEFVELIYENTNIFHPDDFNNLIKKEGEAFLEFLKIKNMEQSSLKGKRAAASGLGKKVVLSLHRIYQTFLFTYIPAGDHSLLQYALEVINTYMSSYLYNYIEEQNRQIRMEQEQLYQAMIETISRQREELLEKEKEQNRQRTAFLINLAHETKLPLTIIQNQINMVIEEAGKRQLQTVPPLEEQIRGLQEMIGNILDYEKILQGKVLYNHDIIVNISKIVAAKIDLFKVITEKKNISMESEIQEGLHIRIAPLALDRILNNIIDNAIKYNRIKGSIHIKTEEDDSSVFFIVQDTGIGIPSNQIQHIFKPYYQCAQKKRGNEGIGAGLALVKSILAEVSGTIKVDSILNMGTTVTISFKKVTISKDDKYRIVEDIKISKPVLRTNITLKQEVYDEKKKTILIVEDNTELLSYLQKSMINDFNFYYAINGNDALQRLEIIPKPDVIISDIMMDIMDGYEFLTKLREKKEMQDIPFIFLTAKVTEEDKLKGLKQGAVDYIEKPFSVQFLKEKIKSLIRDHDIYSEKEIERMEQRLLKTIRTRESIEVSHDVLYSKFNLSKREREIVQYLIKGMDSKDIAEKLFISYDTVKRHIQNIKEKCNVKNIVQLINLFHV
ncbi:MAG: response regulator [Spirochaetales bacterium]|nr:response regulator [Spirochaetales bacterium]